ncbi:hypothetical protein [Plantactinospora sp. CA-290183]|uniref:hypothetical protein n=1 Tax=Plantactinospora sp. CA-290183 TaxID=3240006 RepID=UPI003D91CE6B
MILTVGTTNAYLSGAAALARSVRPVQARRAAREDTPPAWYLAIILVSGGALIGPAAAGTVSMPDLVAVPTTFFLVVYLGCTAAACRLLRGPARIAAAVAHVAVVAILAFSGYALIPAAAVTVLAVLARRRGPVAAATRPAAPPAEARSTIPVESRRS